MAQFPMRWPLQSKVASELRDVSGDAKDEARLKSFECRGRYLAGMRAVGDVAVAYKLSIMHLYNECSAWKKYCRVLVSVAQRARVQRRSAGALLTFTFR